ncbi:MAG: class I SAM-dependent methyltransferase [Prolixibacteraceae bacterium]|nr:class I SAM-dependent methyltransferase [Prolixibacteraceae bacterium]NLO02777.1 class I SAM-dependent methyltransferase [Bacteroidales bacterium]
MGTNKTYLSTGDFIDLFYKLRQKGYLQLLSNLNSSKRSRTIAKWDTQTSSSDFWVIPEIRRRWNMLSTGNPDLEYEDYVVSNYLSGKKGLKMLSVGCGTGSRERKFAKYPCFELIEGIDLAPGQISEARTHASEMNLNNIKYINGDFLKADLSFNNYDLILFNSSLHHFNNIEGLLQSRVLPLLKNSGLLVIFEYAGPDRLQCTRLQLEYANKLLQQLPLKYKIRFKSNSVKRKIYRPGLIRMFLIDPSEAADSESIIPSIHRNFRILEEKKLGWDISYLLFKDIAHNFLRDDEETLQLLTHIFQMEDEYIKMTGRSDGIFGIYQKQATTTGLS